MKPKLLLCLAFVLSICVAMAAISQNRASSKLTPQAIAKKTLDAYAALSSYSDTGTTVEAQAGAQVITTTFSIRMQRPKFFRIIWSQTDGNQTNNGSCYSGTDPDYVGFYSYSLNGADGQETNGEWMPFVMGDGRMESWQALIVPNIFLPENFGLGSPDNILSLFASRTTNTAVVGMTLTDGKIGSVDCHVISMTINSVNYKNFQTPKSITWIWIGKQDYLIHQTQMSRDLPLIQTSNAPNASPEYRETVFTQTHENISVNQKFPMEDFEQKRKVSPPVIVNFTNPAFVPRPNPRATNATVTVQSAEFGMGNNVADVTARVAELMRDQSRGFVVNAQNLGQDPLPGKKKRLVIHYVCEGFTNVITIPAGYNISQYGLVDHAESNHPKSAR